MNIWDIVVIALIGAAVVLALRHMRNRSETGCTGSCTLCSRGCGRHMDA